ncbi:putative phage tail protein [Lysinibacillus sp. KU-BSD001]|uniref:putative phage tail protein n=1 Tax=Lysinibacillus sp. KU-BSD001 TaxID=3141328 RepID=UPI0036E407D8
MVRNIDIVQYWPPVLRDIKEMLAIAKVENPVLSALWELLEQTLNDQFVVTVSEDGANRYEQTLNLQVMDNDSIETRRFRILTRYQEQAPYTEEVLIRLLNSLLGNGAYELTINKADKTVDVKLELTVRGMFDAAKDLLERIVPQNMELTVRLRYIQHSVLQDYRHIDLKPFTHDQIRNGVIS